MSHAPLGVAVVGLGVGEQHARAVARLPAAELRWLHDLDESRSTRVASELGAGRVAASYDEILQDAATSVVVIASYDDVHAAQVIAALDAGKHVFVEKPICRGRSELVQVADAWHRHAGRLHLGSNLVLRAAPLYRWLREAVAAGELGELYSLDGEYLYGRLEKILRGWRGNLPGGYSVMEGGGIHLIDLLLWISRERPTFVQAMGARIATKGTPFNACDFVTSHLAFPSGMVGRVTANFGCVHRHHHVVRAFGTKATVLYDDAGPRIHTTSNPDGRAAPLPHAPLPATKAELLGPFLDDILAGRDCRDETQGYLDAMSVAVACDEAVRMQGPVKVAYV